MDNAQGQGAQRTLQILSTLSCHPDLSVSSLRRHTGISRPAIYRLLETLSELGFVKRHPVTTTYRLTAKIRTLAAGFRDEDHLVELCKPILDELQREIIWPTDFVCYEDGAMICKESSRPQSPLVIERDTIGARIPVLRSAVGIAYLAFSPAATRELILSILRKSNSPDDALARDPAAIHRLINRALRQGYGVRDRTYRPRTCSIAVVVPHKTRVLGCIAMEFIVSALKPQEAAEKYLHLLKAAASRLLSRWEAATAPPKPRS